LEVLLQLMAQGYSNARIARELFVTEKAVARSIALIFTTSTCRRIPTTIAGSWP
jgi:DNA-binding NarL/FixJ family response regulator